MNIVVFIKQVPDTDNVKWTANNNIDRANMDCIINPVDRQALEAALELKDKYGFYTIAITMGPKNSVSILKEAIAMGIDDAYLLCDSKFAGSDTCATSRVLSNIIKERFSDTHIILFGQSAIDGETSQTGPSTATRLNMPFLTQISEIKKYENYILTVEQETTTEKSTFEIVIPAVLCINNYKTKPRIPMINGHIKASKYNFKMLNLYDCNLKDFETGIKGSPTCVSKVYRHDLTRECKYIDTSMDANYPEVFCDEIKEAMEN